jgi:hypothetical protein
MPGYRREYVVAIICRYAVVTLVGRWVLVLPVLQELKEFLRATLLKEAHEWALDSLHLRTRNLGDLAVTVDEASSDLLELQIASDFSVDEDFRQFSRGDDELGNEVDGIVSVAPKLGGRCLIWTEFTVELLSRSTPDECEITNSAHTWVKFKLALSAP